MTEARKHLKIHTSEKRPLSITNTNLLNIIYPEKYVRDTHLLKYFMTHCFTVKMNQELPWFCYFLQE